LSVYRRVITGVSTFIFLVHQVNKLLLKFEGRILQWAFENLESAQITLVSQLISAVHSLDPILQEASDD